MDSTALPASFGLFMLVFVVATVWAYWRIAKKAGYPAAYSLLMLVPLVNLVALIYFALEEWPVERELRAFREHYRRDNP